MERSPQPAPSDPAHQESREALLDYITRMLAAMPVGKLRLVYHFALHL